MHEIHGLWEKMYNVEDYRLVHTSYIFVFVSVGVEEMQETIIFQTITDQIQFAMYALSLLAIIVSGVVVAFAIEIKN